MAHVDSQEELDIIAGLHAPFQSAGDSQYMLSFSSDGKRLHLLGRRLDRISACGLSCAAYSADLPTSGPSFNSGRGLLSFCNAIPSWARIAAQMSEYCTEESMETVFTKTLTCNRFIASPLTPDIQEKITRWIAFITACHEDSRLTLDGTGVLTMLDFTQDPEMQGIAEGAFVSCIGRKMFSSSYLYLGMAPSRAREGDLIVLFHGCPAPFVLRECEEGFQLIGAAYVHGIMDGEARVGLSSDNDEWFTLI